MNAEVQVEARYDKQKFGSSEMFFEIITLNDGLLKQMPCTYKFEVYSGKVDF